MPCFTTLDGISIQKQFCSHCACANVVVHITSWYPKFNGSHFGLPPISIHKKTGLGSKMVCTMTFGRRTHFAESSSLTNVYHLILLCDCPEFDPHDHQLARRSRSHHVIMISLCCQQMWVKTTARWGFLLSVCNSTHLLLKDYFCIELPSILLFSLSNSISLLLPVSLSVFLPISEICSLCQSFTFAEPWSSKICVRFRSHFPAHTKKLLYMFSHVNCHQYHSFATLYMCVTLLRMIQSFFFCPILSSIFFFFDRCVLLLLLKWEKAKLVFKIVTSSLCWSGHVASSLIFKLSWLTWRVEHVTSYSSINVYFPVNQILVNCNPMKFFNVPDWAWKTSSLSKSTILQSRV